MKFTHELKKGTLVRLDDGRVVTLADERKGLVRYINDGESIRSYQIVAYFDVSWHDVIYTKAEMTLRSRFLQLGL